MAELNTALYTKQVGGTDTLPVNDADYRRNIKYIYVTYTMTGDEAASDTINAVLLEANVIPLPQFSKVVNDGIATTATITIGDGDDADLYSTALDVAASGSDDFTGFSALEHPAIGSYTPVVITFATLATPVAGKKLEMQLAVAEAE